jgi:hypothetical protein
MSKNNAEASNVRGNLRRVYSDTCLRVFFDRKLQMDERKIETSSNTDLKPNLGFFQSQGNRYQLILIIFLQGIMLHNATI